MVIIRLQGGLGNQMFQYAYGRALALRQGTELRLDLSAMTNRRHSIYSLDNFSIGAEIASKEEISKLITPHFALKFRLKKALKIPFSYVPTHLKETKFSFDDKMYSASTSCYCEGFWQTEKYFTDCSDTIRRDFEFKNAEEFKKNPTYKDATRENSVAVHIRRGDYVSNARYRRQLFVCDKNYYLRSMDFLREKIGAPHFVIFSDDPSYVRENFGGSSDVSFATRASSATEDMWLMSQCKHIVISNSSFSWWAAWLGSCGGEVLAPSKWFTDAANVDYSDVVPDRWTKISPSNNANI